MTERGEPAWPRRKTTPADIGARIRSSRLARGLNQQELAAQAGLHRTVVARAEAGQGCRASSLQKIGRALGITYTWLRRPFLDSKPYRIDRADETLWVATRPSYVRRKGLVSPETLQSEGERQRLGLLGLSNAFVRILNTELPGGRMYAMLVESYRSEQGTVSFPGQMFLFVLKGKIRLQVGEDFMELGPGDSAGYWGDQPNHYAPLEDSELPCVILEVFVDLSDDEIAVREQFRTSA